MGADGGAGDAALLTGVYAGKEPDTRVGTRSGGGLGLCVMDGGQEGWEMAGEDERRE